jgi:hypothetical protein
MGSDAEGRAIAATVVPQAIKNAQSEMALADVDRGDLGDVRSKKPMENSPVGPPVRRSGPDDAP